MGGGVSFILEESYFGNRKVFGIFLLIRIWMIFLCNSLVIVFFRGWGKAVRKWDF